MTETDRTVTRSGARLRSEYAAGGGVHAVFSGKVADYVASRPDYPAELFETLASHCALRPDAQVVDVGSGTGLFSRGLLAHGWKVIGVEPNAAMREAACHQLGASAAFRCVDGSAEALPLRDASADLVCAAQAFHWFDVDAARAEFLRVLAPDGRVALVWNDRQQGDSLHRALDEVFETFGGTKRAALLAHEDRSDVPRFYGRSTPQQWSWPHEHRLDAAGLASLVFSRSYMPARESHEGRQVKHRTREVFERFAERGSVSVRYTTVAIVGRPNWT